MNGLYIFQVAIKKKMRNSKTFICRQSDKELSIMKAAFRLAKQMIENSDVDITISNHVDKKTMPQHRTVWLWCTEAAYQLSEMGRMTGKGGSWAKDDVYSIVFKGRFMPKREKVMPDGTIEYIPIGLSDKEAYIEAVTEAMTRFQVWAAELGIELTQPDDLKW